MYNVKGSTKIVTKTTTRRGITQNIENYKDYNRNRLSDTGDSDILNDPKPVFQRKCTFNSERQKNISPHHEEIVNFIYESWNSVFSEVVESELAEERDKRSRPAKTKTFFYEDEPCNSLQDFKPFDLESWWGRRLYACITNSANTNS